MKEITDEIIKEAWSMRQRGLWTMREISGKLEVNREELIRRLNEYIARNKL